MYLLDVFLEFEVPLRKVLVAKGLCPLVRINVQFFLLDLALLFRRLLFRRLLFALLPFLLFRLFFLNRPFQRYLLFNIILFLPTPNSQVPDLSNILLNPVQVLANKLVFSLPEVYYDDVPFSRGFCYFSSLLETVDCQVYEAAVVTYCDVLVQ
jgi:hypothetical protein